MLHVGVDEGKGPVHILHNGVDIKVYMLSYDPVRKQVVLGFDAPPEVIIERHKIYKERISKC